MKNPLTPAGIEPVTYRFVAQHLNHFATAVFFITQMEYFFLRYEFVLSMLCNLISSVLI
jgi:hypothetical protein